MDRPLTPAQVSAEILTYEQWMRDNPCAADDSKAEVMRRLRVLKLKLELFKKQQNDNNSN